jgi:hypothetical protein
MYNICFNPAVFTSAGAKAARSSALGALASANMCFGLFVGFKRKIKKIPSL